MFFVVMIIIGTIYVSVNIKRRAKMLDEELKIGLNIDVTSVESWLDPNILEKFFNCFYLLGNFRFIMSGEISKSSIPSIHGIRLVKNWFYSLQTYFKSFYHFYTLRSIAMLWIMLGHVYIFGFSTIDNIQFIYAYADKWILQPIFSSAISVDTFFVLR